jgi:hypothetical protein
MAEADCGISLPPQAAKYGRGERIRTSGPCLPKTVLYQAELLPDRRSGRVRGEAEAAL